MKNFNYEFHPFYPQDLKREGAQKLARAVLETLDEDIAQCQKEMQKSWRKVVDSFFLRNFLHAVNLFRLILIFVMQNESRIFCPQETQKTRCLNFGKI